MKVCYRCLGGMWIYIKKDNKVIVINCPTCSGLGLIKG